MIFRFDRVIFGLLAIVLVMSSAQQQAKADKSVVLTEQEILTQIIGNTASGTSAKRRGRTDNRPYQGKWTVSGSYLCFVYDDSGDAGCWTISVKGNELTYYMKGHHDVMGTLLKGNPKNF